MDPIQISGRRSLWSDFCLGRPYRFTFFKGSLPQILLGPFLNILTHMCFGLRLEVKKGLDFVAECSPL